MKKVLILIALCQVVIISNAEAKVKSGLEVFISHYTEIVKGKRVGLITNATGVDSKLRPTVDILHKDPRINLKLLLAPEHGIRGDLRAGETVPDMKDKKTGLPIYTLYGGKDHRPPLAALKQVDVIIYDIQDVGSRAYTYIWTLAEAMASAKIHNKTVIVLDRPNPLGATVVDGPITEKKWLSFIGLYPIPRVYGMTVGELARLLNKHFKIGCHLQVVPMQGYRRGMSWAQTGLPWVPTSPNIPSVASANCFAATGTIGTIGGINIGVGYTLPFQTVAAGWMDADRSAEAMNSYKLPGVKFRPIHYKPFSGKYANKQLHGVQLHILDAKSFHPATTELALISHLRSYYPSYLKFPAKAIPSFDKAMGTSSVRLHIEKNGALNPLLQQFKSEIEAFKKVRAKYLIKSYK